MEIKTERQVVGEIPEDVEDAISAIHDGGLTAEQEKSFYDTLNDWAGDNEMRINHIQANIEDREDSGGRRTYPATLTQNGTGLRGQEKTPKP